MTDINIDNTIPDGKNLDATESIPVIVDYRDVDGEAGPEVVKEVVNHHLELEDEHSISIDAFLIIGTEYEFGTTRDTVSKIDAEILVEHLGIPVSGAIAFKEISEDLDFSTEEFIEEYREELLR